MQDYKQHLFVQMSFKQWGFGPVHEYTSDEEQLSGLGTFNLQSNSPQIPIQN